MLGSLWELPAIVAGKTSISSQKRDSWNAGMERKGWGTWDTQVSVQLPSGNSNSTWARYCSICTRIKEVHRKPLQLRASIMHLKINLWSFSTHRRKRSYIAQIWRASFNFSFPLPPSNCMTMERSLSLPGPLLSQFWNERCGSDDF